jgi:hypothetical protein
MAAQVSAKETHAVLEQHLHGRSDLGVWKAISARILEPRNPFEPEPHRRPQRWFAVFLLVAFASTGAVIYFNFWP